MDATTVEQGMRQELIRLDAVHQLGIIRRRVLEELTDQIAEELTWDDDGAAPDVLFDDGAATGGSMSSTSGCGATEGVSHAKSLWQRLSGGEGSEQVNKDERQRKR